MRRTTTALPAGVMALFLSGCMADPSPDVLTSQTAPVGEACMSTQVLPAVVETVTERQLVKAAILADDGSVLEPAVYRTSQRQAIISERRIKTYQTLCPADMTPELIATLQRALKARGYYTGATDGQMSDATKAAVARFQGNQGLPTDVLSMDIARQLGLIAYAREDL